MRKLYITLIVTFIFTGCSQIKPKEPPRKYSVNELIKIIQKNTSKFRPIRCKGGTLTIKLPKDKGGDKIDFDGLVVLYQPERRFYLSGTILGKPLLIMGSNDERLWIEILKEPTKLYWGKWKEIDPRKNLTNAFIEAIGYVKPISTDYIGPFLQIRKDCNALMYGKLNEKGEWFFAKEIHLTRYEPILIKRIVYFNPDNTPTLIINLSNHIQISSGAYVPRRIEIIFPEEASYAKVNLGKIEVKDQLPTPAFQFPDTEFFEKVHQIR